MVSGIPDKYDYGEKQEVQIMSLETNQELMGIITTQTEECREREWGITA